MEKQELLYEGKAKQVYKTEDPNLIILRFKDDANAYGGIKKAIIENKGIYNNKIMTILFKYLVAEGIPTHYIETLNDREMLCKKVDILNFDVSVRNVVAGGMSKRFHIPEGTRLKKPVIELGIRRGVTGNKLINDYGKKTDLSPLAETWELSFHKDGMTTLENGVALSEVASKEDLGVNCEGFDFFPVLVKFIDAQDKLSVQVHPSDEYALANENSLGKTEMWYIVDADEGAGIYLGFKEDITKEQFVKAIEEKTLTDYLKFIPVKKGESYFIPSGTIHAICAGCLICEIQQNSNKIGRAHV